MNKVQSDFSDAIFEINSEKIIITLSKGAMINNSNTKKNTINYAIKSLLDNPVDKFNTKFIEVLLDAGGTICNSRTNKNTLEMIIKKVNNYIDKAKINNNDDVAKKNILELLNFILPKGAVICNHNILLDIMAMECGLEIIILLHEYQVCFDWFSNGIILNNAIRSNNLEIIYEIIMRGGKPQNIQFKFHWSHNTFETFLNNFRRDDIKKFDRAIYLLLCSGTTIRDDLFDKLVDDTNPHYKKKISCCYDLLRRKKIQTDEELQDKNELKKELIKTMKELMDGCVPKRNIVEQIDIGVQHCIPVPCVNIIYDYQHSESLVQFIDWSKY